MLTWLTKATLLRSRGLRYSNTHTMQSNGRISITHYIEQITESQMDLSNYLALRKIELEEISFLYPIRFVASHVTDQNGGVYPCLSSAGPIRSRGEKGLCIDAALFGSA